MTGKKYEDLKQWARESGPYFLLADGLCERGKVILDDRGDVDGKLHIECPFEAEHTSNADGGTFVRNAGNRQKAPKDLTPGFVIYCSRLSPSGTRPARYSRHPRRWPVLALLRHLKTGN